MRTVSLVSLAIIALALTSCYERPPEIEQALAQSAPKPINDTPAPAASPTEAREQASATADSPAGDTVADAAPTSESVPATNGATEPEQPPDGESTAAARGPEPTAEEYAANGTASPEPEPVEPTGENEAAEVADGSAEVTLPTQEGEPDRAGDGAIDWAAYITVDELKQELTFMIEQMETKVQTRRDFDRYYRDLQGDASVLGVLGVILQQHPQAGKLRRVGAAIAEASIDLAIATEERSAAAYQDTKDAILRAKEALTTGAAGTDVQPVEWEDVADLTAVMHRMDVAYRRIRGGVNSPTFQKDAYELSHEARLLAILAKVSSHYRDNEPGYVRYAEQLEQMALTAARASLDKNVDEARRAVSNIGRICNECHRAFRLERATGNSLDF